jgi:rhodanese-related sulfurtransferase
MGALYTTVTAARSREAPRRAPRLAVPLDRPAVRTVESPTLQRCHAMPHTTPEEVIEYEPQEVHELLQAGRILLIDVREPAEFAAERIPGALLYPLSTFDAGQLPPDESRQIVFQCAAGGRSLTAARARMAHGQPGAHLAGGISEWKAAGLPTIRIDPRTGRPI